MSSMFDAMMNNAALKANMANAAKTREQKQGGNFPEKPQYDGPDGKLVVVLTEAVVKTNNEGRMFSVIKFEVDHTVDGQEQYKGQEVPSLFMWFDNDAVGTPTDIQQMFFDNLQKMGYDTESVPLDKLAEQIQQDINIGTRKVNVAVLTSKRNKKYRNTYINGVATEGSADVKYEASTGEDTSADVDVLPSMWVGFQVQYKPTPAGEVVTVTVTEADDAAGTITLSADDQVYDAVPFNSPSLVFPE